jgi:hypothetical protein
VPSQASPDAPPELRGRVPSAGDEHEIGIEGLGRPVGTGERDRPDPDVAVDSEHGRAVAHLDAGLAGGIARGPAFAGVDDRRDLDSRARERHRRLVAGVVRAEHHGSLARQHAEPVGVQHRRGGEHHARQIVAGEADRTLVGARREHHPAGAHVVHTLDRRASFVYEDGAVVVDAQGGSVGEHRDVRGARERSTRRRDPGERRLSVDLVAGGDGAAQPRPLVHDQHPVAGMRRLERRAQAGDARSDHDRLDVHVPVPGDRGSGVVGGQPADAGSRGGRDPVHELHGGRRHDRSERGRRELDERVGLLDAGGEHAAGPALQRRARDDVDSVGDERARQRVAGEALVAFTVERERQRTRAIDAVARRRAETPAAHAGPIGRGEAPDGRNAGAITGRPLRREGPHRRDTRRRSGSSPCSA